MPPSKYNKNAPIIFLDSSLTSPLLSSSQLDDYCADDDGRFDDCDIETAVKLDRNDKDEGVEGKHGEKTSCKSNNEDGYRAKLEAIDLFLQIILMISIIHRDFYIRQTYSFVIIAAYALTFLLQILSSASSPSSFTEETKDEKMVRNTRRNAENDDDENDKREIKYYSRACIWGEFFMQHAGYISLLFWDAVFMCGEWKKTSLPCNTLRLFELEIVLCSIILVSVIAHNFQLLFFGRMPTSQGN